MKKFKQIETLLHFSNKYIKYDKNIKQAALVD